MDKYKNYANYNIVNNQPLKQLFKSNLNSNKSNNSLSMLSNISSSKPKQPTDENVKVEDSLKNGKFENIEELLKKFNQTLSNKTIENATDFNNNTIHEEEKTNTNDEKKTEETHSNVKETEDL